jgi:hypothetical protein
MTKWMRMSPTTRKGVALAIGALCVALVGAALAWRVLATDDGEPVTGGQRLAA